MNLAELALEGILRANTLGLRNRAAYIDLGQTQMHLKHYREAAEAYRRALALAPNDLACVYNLGAALSRVGDPQAQEYFARAIEIFERVDFSKIAKAQQANYYEAISNAYLTFGKTDTAIKLLETALSLGKDLEKSVIFSSRSYNYIPQAKWMDEVTNLLARVRSQMVH